MRTPRFIFSVTLLSAILSAPLLNIAQMTPERFDNRSVDTGDETVTDAETGLLAVPKASDWMAQIGDNSTLVDMSIPGTHNSGTFKHNGRWSRCQDKPIQEQLEWGVRFLDLRVGLNKKGEPMIVHGRAGNAGLSLVQAMMQVNNFLDQHDKEAVICVFAAEAEYMEQDKVMAKIEEALYSHSHMFRRRIFDEPRIPKLGEVRGKFLYWKRQSFNDSRGGLWVEWIHNKNTEGKKIVGTDWEIYVHDKCEIRPENKKTELDKWMIPVGEFLEKYRDKGSKRLYITFTSGYHKIDYSPRGFAEVVHPYLKTFFWYRPERFFGIVAMDFVTAELAQRILEKNFQSKPGVASFAASPTLSSILVEWESSSENHNAGFFLWRKTPPKKHFTRLNQEIIPAEGQFDLGAHYEYEDIDVLLGITYTYQLEVVDIYGHSTRYRPASATIGNLITVAPKDGERVPMRPPPSFSWSSEYFDHFRLEFSKTDAFEAGEGLTAPVPITSWITDLSYTPSAKEWQAIRQLGKKGASVYWRIVGKNQQGGTFRSETSHFRFAGGAGVK